MLGSLSGSDSHSDEMSGSFEEENSITISEVKNKKGFFFFSYSANTIKHEYSINSVPWYYLRMHQHLNFGRY